MGQSPRASSEGGELTDRPGHTWTPTSPVSTQQCKRLKRWLCPSRGLRPRHWRMNQRFCRPERRGRSSLAPDCPLLPGSPSDPALMLKHTHSCFAQVWWDKHPDWGPHSTLRSLNFEESPSCRFLSEMSVNKVGVQRASL